MIAQFDSYYIDTIHEKDAWKICNFMVANEDRFKRYFPKTLEQNLTPTLAKHFCEKKVKEYQNKEEFLFTLKVKESNKLVGLVYIKELDWNKKQGEFAYCIGYPFENQNLMTKAINLLSNYAFKHFDLKTLQIITNKDNIPSVKIALNNQFIWQKTLKNEFTPIGEKPIDMDLYELYNER